MRVAFRVDASTTIGSGHLMRCLTLTDALKQRGAQIRFFSRQMPEYLRKMLGKKGHEFILLNSSPNEEAADDLPHSHWLGTSQAADAQKSVQALSDQTWDWLVVDHYALDARWETALRQSATNIMVIDDLADRRHDCDVLLDQNLYEDMDTRYTGKVPPHCQLLLGPRYALLREEFCRLRSEMRLRNGSVKRVLVFLGGMDAHNQTEKAINALARLPVRPLDVDVVIGAQHPARKEIEAVCSCYGYKCHVQTPDIAELMARADLAIGASGSTSWERCCLGLPMICLTHASNQEEIAKGLQAQGAIIYLGDGAVISEADLSKTLLSMIDQPDQLKFLATVSSGLVDGNGATRVCERLLRAE